MALTLVQAPEIISPVNNPIPIVYSSSNASNVGLRYLLTIIVFDVFPNDIGQTQLWIYPDSNHSDYMIYNVSMLLADYIGTDNYWNSGLTIHNEDMIEFIYGITEYIGDTAVDQLTDNNIYKVFRGVKQYGDFWRLSDYLMTKNPVGEFLTNWKTDRHFRETDYATLKAFHGTVDISHTSYWSRALITTYEDDGTSVQYSIYPSGNPNKAYTGTTSIYTLPFGPKNLNYIGLHSDNYELYIYTGGTYHSFNGTPISSDVDYYSIVLQESGTSWDNTSETLYAYVDRNSSKFDGVQFLWLGDLGNYETFTFIAKDVKTYNIEKVESRKNYWDFNITYTYKIGDRGRRLVSVKTQEEHSVYTGWISSEISENLMELYRSPEVFIIQNDNIYPIIIMDKAIEEKTKLNNNNQMFFHTITFEMGYEKLSNI